MKKKIEDMNIKNKTVTEDNKKKLYNNIQECQGILNDFDEDDKFMD